MNVSFFIHRYKKDSVVITLSEFVDDVRGPRWKVLTEAHRRYLGSGMLKEAADVKDMMNGIIASGTCHGGHAAAQVVTLSGWMMLDFDHIGSRTAEVFARLCALSYIGVAFVSISGEGIKAFVRIEVESAQEYATAYMIVAEEVSAQVGVVYDKACSDLGRICSAVYDPGIYYAPDAEPFPWSAKVSPVVPFPPAAPLPAAGQASGFMQSFLDEFAGWNTFVRGGRHDFMLKLGRVARHKGFSLPELDALKLLATSRFSESDYTALQGEKDISSGYQFVSMNPKPGNPPSGFTKVQGSPMNPTAPGKEEEDEDALLEKSNELRAVMPAFPEEVYSQLPDLLARGMVAAHGPRECDMLLMGMMANLSVCLPSVRFLYGGMTYSPHLYFAGVAPAGTGKGVVALASYLAQPLHRHYTELAAEQRKLYEEKKRIWDIELHEAFRGKRKPDASLRPEEPHGICIMLPANTSKARVYAHLKDNGELGAIMNATEINTLVAAIGQDYGKQDDVLCAAAHHEDLSSSFKVDGLPIFVSEPRLGICITGTPNQFVGLIHSMENGLYSRFGLLTAQAHWRWRSAAPVEGAIEYRSYFRGLGHEVLAMHKTLLETPTVVTFTPAQWEEHKNRFDGWLNRVAVEGDASPGEIVLRHGLLAMRMAAVLTTLRKVESRWFVKEYICEDRDFHTAMSMIEVLLEHSLLLSSSLPGTALKSRPLQKFHRVNVVLDKLTSIFTYTEFIKEAMSGEASESTAKRWLKRAEKAKLVVCEGGIYKKNGK